jgi:superfamily II DNA or RNA helicase
MRLNSWLEIEEDDGYNFDILKARLMVPNPDYVSRMQQGFSTAGLNRFDPLYEEVHRDGKSILRVPRALVNKYGVGREVEDCREEGKEVDFKFRLRLGPTEEREEDQVDFVDALVKAVEKNTGAIGQANPGYGKTACALAIVARLSRTTAVLVHKSFLMNQWIERIEEAFDISPDEIGMVQQDVCDFRGKKIVLIMAQSLLARSYPEELYRYFGTVVVDEVHRFGAVEFRKAITMFPAKYRIGVTATPKRKDGLEDVFFMHIGDIAFVGAKRRMVAKIQYVNAKMIVTDSMKRGMLNWQKKFDLNKVTQYIVDCETRNRQIVQLLVQALKAGRKILLLSARREHLNVLAKLFELECVKQHVRFAYGFYVGGMEEEALRISATRPLILATFQMAQEGLDIPELDTLFLATPKGDVTQAVGRILRKYDGKKQPMVVDILDNDILLCENLARKRAKQYREMGCIF